jgi:hypothetical protein
MNADHQIFDRGLYVSRLKRKKTGAPNTLAETIAEELAERLSLITRQFENALVIAPWPGTIAEAVKRSGKVKQLAIQEIGESDDLGLIPQSFDAIFNILDLHAVNDVPGQLAQIFRGLKPDGLFLAALFAGNTLTELRQSWLSAEGELMGGASPRVSPMIGVRELGSLLQRAGFALPVADLDRTIVRYGDAIALIHEISSLGLSNNLLGRSRKPVTRGLLGAAVSHYHQHFSDADARIRATIEIAWMTGWSPHASQQQPLKPGSAKQRLADALKVPETKLTEE